MSAARDLADGAQVINILDGITATTTELNHTDGVTSGIQTQLDSKQSYDANLTSFVTAFTLPTSDDSENKVLSTDGNGNLFFANVTTNRIIDGGGA